MNVVWARPLGNAKILDPTFIDKVKLRIFLKIAIFDKFSDYSGPS